MFPLFRLSYHWIAPLGLFATLIVGALVGWLFDKREDIKLDAELYTPAVWRWLPSESMERLGESRRSMGGRDVDSPAPSSPLIMERMENKVSYLKIGRQR